MIQASRAPRLRLDAPTWRDRAARHARRIDALTAGHRQRRARGLAHPVEDFLFTYYPFTVASLRRWHPGPAVVLLDAAGDERAGWPFYRATDEGLELDQAAYLRARADEARRVRELLSHTAVRPMQLGCFGLHEWAMVYRLDAAERRHPRWPLRLGAAGTDAVVESHALRCTHVDAYRFFTPAARPRNALTPNRERQVEVEQPGCLHATMDLYKWAMRLTPAVPSELVADCFGLALALRVLDMRASPYDLSGLGYQPIAVETTEGKAEYVAAQRRYAAVGQDLRARLVAVCDALLAEAPVFAAPEVSANPVGEPESGLRLPPP
ncbi:MAG: 3-methyladenine DNA glycosylase [Dermatophilaceae bacterium]